MLFRSADCQSSDVKEKMKIAANVFLKSRTIGEAEAAFRLIPSLTLSNSSVKCVFASTDLPDERCSRYRKATDAQINAGIPCVEIEGREGLWYEQRDLWSKYQRRPAMLEELCFAQFCKMYESDSSSSNKENPADDSSAADDDDVVEGEGIDIESIAGPGADEEEVDDDAKFHHIKIGRAHV